MEQSPIHQSEQVLYEQVLESVALVEGQVEEITAMLCEAQKKLAEAREGLVVLRGREAVEQETALLLEPYLRQIEEIETLLVSARNELVAEYTLLSKYKGKMH